MTKAEKIVEKFFGDNPDGQEWPEGFGEALEFGVWKPPYHPTLEAGISDSYIYEFEDGSCIVESGGAWDFGYTGSTCGCWVSEPHRCRDTMGR